MFYINERYFYSADSVTLAWPLFALSLLSLNRLRCVFEFSQFCI